MLDRQADDKVNKKHVIARRQSIVNAKIHTLRSNLFWLRMCDRLLRSFDSFLAIKFMPRNDVKREKPFSRHFSPLTSHSSAFTLAEVLIVLGIIGIIAEMTIPTLMNNVSDQENVAGIKKIYSEIYSATTMMQSDNAAIWDSSSADSKQNSFNMADGYKQYLKFLKEDTINNIVNSVIYGYKSTTYVIDDTANTNRYGLVLNNGAILRFYSAQNCTGVPLSGSFSICGDIVVDVSGNKKPNMFGKDVYDIIIAKDSSGNYKILPAGETIGYTCVAGSVTQTTSYGCTDKVILGEKLP